MPRTPNFKLILSNQAVAFDYVNHRNDLHTYVVQPESLEYGLYDDGGAHGAPPMVWVLNAHVQQRDGEPRGGIRRTFILSKIQEPRMVPL